jgi:hypothetical protein
LILLFLQWASGFLHRQQSRSVITAVAIKNLIHDAGPLLAS